MRKTRKEWEKVVFHHQRGESGCQMERERGTSAPRPPLRPSTHSGSGESRPRNDLGRTLYYKILANERHHAY
jgi:hypothetical protein